MGTVLFTIVLLTNLVSVLWGLQTLDTKQGPIRLLGWAAVVVGLSVLLLCCGVILLAGL